MKIKIKRKPVIIVTAMASTGKTTVAKAVVKKYGFKFYDGGDVLKMIAKEAGYKVTRSKSWWDTLEGMKFLAHRKTDPEFDYKIDKKFMKLAEKGGVVFTSWTLPWIYKGGIKVWLSASVNTRAKRLANRDKIPVGAALKVIHERDKENIELYKKLYGIALGTDTKPFDVIIDTENLDTKQVTKEVIVRIDKLLKNKK